MRQEDTRGRRYLCSARSLCRAPVRAAGCVGLLAATLLAGCTAAGPTSSPRPVSNSKLMSQNPQPPTQRFDPTKVETRDDIVMVRSMWQAFPWLYDTENAPVGFQVPVYFVSGETEKGAFVPGKIHCRAYRVLRTHEGQNVRELLHEWTFSEQQATGFRATKKFILGNCYGFMLTWPKEIRAAGQEIEIEFGYERLNGSIVTGTPRRLQVPMPGQRHTPTIGSSEHFVRSGERRVPVAAPNEASEPREEAAGTPRIQVRTSTRGRPAQPDDGGEERR